MASFKDTFEAQTFAAGTFACGAWRGGLLTGGGSGGKVPLAYYVGARRERRKPEERKAARYEYIGVLTTARLGTAARYGIARPRVYAYATETQLARLAVASPAARDDPFEAARADDELWIIGGDFELAAMLDVPSL